MNLRFCFSKKSGNLTSKGGENKKMYKFLYKAGTGIAAAAIIAQGFAGLALASIDVEISGNGANSTNDANVAVSDQTQVTQNNTANITNNVNVSADTGKNDANKNTGGDVDITTGNATTTVGVSNTANANVADVNGCCVGDLNVTISGNGAKSDNEANVGVANSTWVSQNNYAKIKNNVDVDSDTGKNDANANTGGSVSITTGNADTNVAVSNTANKNIATVGNGSGGGGGSLSVVISGNGYKSTNLANVALASTTGVQQNNRANITNDVDVDADTGKNDANKNTGGDVEILTGNADADVDVSNLANFNFADVDSCGCILDGTVKIAGNGAKSDNEANVVLVSATLVGQNNDYACGYGHRGGNDVITFSEDGDHKSKPCNDVNVDLDTGKNDANGNTGDPDGDPSVTTGNAEADVVVETTANSNIVGDSDFDFDFPEIDFGGSSASLLLMLLAFFS